MEHGVLYFLSNTIIFLWQVSPHGDLVHDFQVVLLVGEKNPQSWDVSRFHVMGVIKAEESLLWANWLTLKLSFSLRT